MVEKERLRKFGRYDLIAHLATGGMAEIFLARQTGIGGFEKLVVIKQILPHLSRDAGFVSMFFDEARTAARLNHQNIVQIFDLGCEEGQYYIAMEYLEGESLAEVLRQSHRMHQPFSAALAAGIAAQVCDGLHYAHSIVGPDGQSLQIVHRDISPQNIFVLYSGGVKLVDFGIAKTVDRITKTSDGMLKGKLGYMSPEQVRNLPLDTRSDLYSAGVVLWELLAGRKLHRHTSDLDILKAITEADQVPPSNVVPTVPAELDRICTRALARSREVRYQTAGEMRMELLHFIKRTNASADATAVAELMEVLFAERMMEKRRVIKSARTSGGALGDVLFGDIRWGKSDTEPSLSLLTPPGAPAQTNSSDGKTHPPLEGRIQVPVPPSRAKTPTPPLASEVLRPPVSPVRSPAVLLGAGFGLIGLLVAAITWVSLTPSPAPQLPSPPVGHDLVLLSNKPQVATTLRSEPLLSPPVDKPTPKVISQPPSKPVLKTSGATIEVLPPGKLRLATVPWTTVYFMDKKLGITPLVDVELPAGMHTLKAVNPDKGIERKIQVEIKPGETTSRSVTF